MRGDGGRPAAEAPVAGLTPDRVRRTCDPSRFAFTDTRELHRIERLAGQDRARGALEFGLGIDAPGYNIFALGPPGTGRRTGVLRALEARASTGLPPPDWCYVQNFAEPHRPVALSLPAGYGEVLKADMAALVDELGERLTRAFESEEYAHRRAEASRAFQAAQQARFVEIEAQATARGLAIARAETGLRVVPEKAGQPMAEADFEALPDAERARLAAAANEVEAALEQALRAARGEEKALRAQLAEIDKQTAAFAVAPPFDELAHKYAAYPAVIAYLKAAREDVLANVGLFRPPAEPEAASTPNTPPAAGPPAPNPRVRYGVNVLVDNGRTAGQPVVEETNPTYRNLVGRIEQRTQAGTLVSDFTMIKPGALVRANGGYLVLQVRDLLRNPNAWEGLKRALKTGRVRIEDMGDEQRVVGTVMPEPEPIPIDLKVVLIGDPASYYALFQGDEDFGRLFKVRAEFTGVLDRTPETERTYAMFIAGRAAEEGLRPFDATAVAKVVEHGARLAEDQAKLTAQFSAIADLLREADYWAARRGGPVVNATDVRAAIEAKVYRANLVEQQIRRLIAQGTLLVDTEGAVVGQVNGISVLTLADHAFGKPVRITARTYLGRAGIVNIEREVLLGGRIHNKGVLILAGYLGGRYAQDKPLTLSASLTFEQLYEEMEGDSASSAELYALLSCLADLPLRQDLAVTGSVNQRGEVQPVGGVNQKVEGFYDLCRVRGLTGHQGVLVPERNVRSLMLREDVVAAVAEGRFHVYPVRTIDQGIALLTGVPAGAPGEDGRYPPGTVNARVDARLRRLAEEWRAYRGGGTGGVP